MACSRFCCIQLQTCFNFIELVIGVAKIPSVGFWHDSLTKLTSSTFKCVLHSVVRTTLVFVLCLSCVRALLSLTERVVLGRTFVPHRTVTLLSSGWNCAGDKPLVGLGHTRRLRATGQAYQVSRSSHSGDGRCVYTEPDLCYMELEFLGAPLPDDVTSWLPRAPLSQKRCGIPRPSMDLAYTFIVGMLIFRFVGPRRFGQAGVCMLLVFHQVPPSQCPMSVIEALAESNAPCPVTQLDVVDKGRCSVWYLLAPTPTGRPVAQS